jgi:hypothetical protein
MSALNLELFLLEDMSASEALKGFSVVDENLV